MSVISGLTGVVIMLLMTACANVSGPEQSAMEPVSFHETILDETPKSDLAAEEGRGADWTEPLPESVSRSLLPELDLNLSESSNVNLPSRFDVDAEGVPAHDFFMELVSGTSHNMVVHPDVSGTVSVKLKNVTILEAMKTACELYNFDCLQTVSGFTVRQPHLRTEMFRIDYLDFQRSGLSQTRISSGQVSQSTESGASGTSTTSENVSGTTLSMRNSSDFWQELVETLCRLLNLSSQSISTYGCQAVSTAVHGETEEDQDPMRVVVSRQTGIVTVRATASDLDSVSDYLNTLRQRLAHQVILETKILEVELNEGFQSGINWSSLLTLPDTSNRIVVGQGGGGTVFPTSTGSSSLGTIEPLSATVRTMVDGSTASAFGGLFSAALELNDFAAFIELLKSQGTVRVLSSPRIATLNNQRAVIKVGQDEIFVTDVQVETDEFGNQTADPEFTPFFSGIALDVTPQISDAGDVILHIHPLVSEVSTQNTTLQFGANTLVYPLALNKMRESDSIVRARDRAVVVIGGLMKSEKRDERASVPLLGELPVVGGLFRHTRTYGVKSELVILMRPVVVRASGDWSHEIRKTAERFRRLGP